MKARSKDKTQHGFGIIEILISMMVITSAITGMILINGQRGGGVNTIVGDNQRTVIDDDTANRGIYRASEMLENAESSAVNNFSSIVTASSSDGIFTDKISVTDISPCRKDIISSVNWTVSAGRNQKVELSSSLVGMRESAAMGGDCDVAPPSTNWQNLICDGPSSPNWDFPQDSGIPATGIDVVRRGNNNYAVITSQGSSGGKRDFWIADVTNRASMIDSGPPVKDKAISAMDTGPGLNDVDVAGNYAYVANNDTSKQLQIIDITTLSAPDRIASVSLNTSAIGSEAQALFYYDNKVYIGTNFITDAIHEFQVFNVSTPTAPSLIGTYNVNHNIYDIAVRNEIVSGSPRTLAYLAISDSVGDKPKFIILDVTVPASITQLGSYNPNPQDALYGTALEVIGKRAFLGRQRATGAGKDLVIMDIANVGSPSLLYSTKLNLNNNNEVREIKVSGDYMFMGISKSNASDTDTFQVWNIADLANILITKCSYPQDALDFDIDGNFIYVVNRSNSALRIIYDSSNPFP